jgi:hypothetical protein
MLPPAWLPTPSAVELKEVLIWQDCLAPNQPEACLTELRNHCLLAELHRFGWPQWQFSFVEINHDDPPAWLQNSFQVLEVCHTMIKVVKDIAEEDQVHGRCR